MPTTVSEIHRLTNRHAALEAALSEELKRPVPDAMKVGQLKRQKLKIKDQLASLSRARAPIEA